MDNVTPLRVRRPPSPNPRRRLRTIVIVIVVAAVAIVASLLGRIFGLYVDWLWFGEVGLRSVFWTGVWSRLLLGVIAGVVFFIVVAANIELARRLAPDFRAGAGDIIEPRSDLVRRYIGRIGLIVAAVAAVIAAFTASGAWLLFLRALNATAFGVKDPVFGRDLGFYVFTMPAWHAVQNFALAVLIVSLVAAAVVHLILGGIEYIAAPPPPAGEGPFRGPTNAGQAAQYVRSRVEVHLPGQAIAHLSGLLAAIFIVVGIGQLFRAWNLLYSTAGAVFGAGYTDVHIRLPLARVTMVLAFALAAALIYNIWRRRSRWPIYAVAAWIIALIVLRGIVPAAYQSLFVNPNQLTKEQKYITYNLAATRRSYGLDKITTKPLPMTTQIDSVVLKKNEPTLNNIRLWDPDTLVRSYRQLQQLRPYYSFTDVDVDRYTVNGAYTETMLSARELDLSGLKQQSQTWVNQHITYTHGFGLAMSAVNQVTTDGSPDFLVQDVPPRSAPGLEVTQPRIYYGEIGTDYTLVKTKDREFDYPGAGGEDVYRQYTGSGGIPISPFLAKLAFSWRYGTIKFFTTSAIDSDSRVIIRNNIMDRLRAAAPFLAYDPDPYMVIAGGRLFWIADAYTTSARLPYATPEQGLNYIRNSVKAVVDAYNGTITYYVFDPSDPIIRTYEKIYPDLFKPASAMPPTIRQHVRYPEAMFDIQSEVYSTYHVTDPGVLYNNGDQWQIPDNVSLSGPGQMAAYYVIMSLPQTNQEEFILIRPFVPNQRPNMIAWLGALSDGAEYGKAVAYQFAKGVSVYGPTQVEAAINQDPTISAQRSLWGQQGSRVIMGNLLVIPIEDSLLYVQPLYLEGEQTQLPQMKRVIVFYQSSATATASGKQTVVMQPTLGEALADAFGSAPAVGPVAGTGGTGQGGTGTGGTGTGGTGTGGGLSGQAQTLIQQANREFQAAQKAQQAGNWAEYGRQIKALQQTLGQLQQLQ